MDQEAGQARLQDDQQQVLAQPHHVEAVPSLVDRPAPSVRRLREALGLAILGAEALDRRIRADGVG